VADGPGHDHAVDSELRQSRTYLDSRVAALKTSVDESVSTLLISVDHRIAQKVDAVQSDVLLLHQAVASVQRQWLSAQVAHPTVDSTRPPDRPDAPPEDVASAPDGEEEDEAIVRERAPDLSGRIERLEAEFESFIGSVAAESILETVRREVRDQLTAFALARGQVTDDPADDSVFAADDAEFEAIQRFGAPAPPAAPSELEELRQMLSDVDTAMQERIAGLIGRVERKAETSLVERMFEKLRAIVASVKDDLTVVEGQMEKLVRRIEMESYVETSLSSLLDEEQTATSNRHLRCLACGRPRLKASAAETHVARTSQLAVLPPIKSPTKKSLPG
jgi:hypothetical protein